MAQESMPSPASNLRRLDMQNAEELGPIRRDEHSAYSRESFERLEHDTAASKGSEASEGSPEVDIDTWFVRSNSHIASGVGNSVGDDGTPYFLQHSRAISPQDLSATRASLNNLPRRSECSSAEYRSVIDDLTVENNELRRRLMKFETAQTARLDKDKLFEVKVHGLPPEKKRELEETLQAFASSVDSCPGYGVPFQERPVTTASPVSRPAPSPHSHPNYPRSLGTESPSSLDTSNNSRPVDIDSGYASMQRSKGSNNSSRTTARPSVTLGSENDSQARENKVRKVESFLEDVPEVWLPSNSSSMTDKQKRRNVVRRLERLFTGVSQGPRDLRSQPLQQQEVSKLAAKADKRMEPQFSFAEGHREAQMLPTHQLKMSKSANPCVAPVTEQEPIGKPRADATSATSSLPEQRPTRPLDLDPHRAQIPADNVDYIRHLGLSAPNPTDDITYSAADEEGWIYLNLLIGMAQLHIMHVTLDFVRAAVTEVSEQFEVSPDGQKLRWKGGTRETRFSSASESSSVHRHSDSDDSNEHRRKRHKSGHGKSASANFEPNAPGLSTAMAEEPLGASVHYKPLFHSHRTISDRMLSSDYSSETGHSALSSKAKIRENHSATKASSQKRKKSHVLRGSGQDGPIVFYNSAPFCTDLSGDRKAAFEAAHSTRTTSKLRYTQGDHRHAIGAAPRSNLRSSSPTPSGSFLPGRPFKDYSIGPDLFRIRPKTPELLSGDAEMEFSPSPSSNQPVSAPGALQELTASGLGGSQPSDNFVIKVHSRRRIKVDSDKRPSNTNLKSLLRRISTSSLSSFPGTYLGSRDVAARITSNLAHLEVASRPYDHEALDLQDDPPVKSQILSEEYYEMEPSALPEPRFQPSNTDESENQRRSSSSSDSGRQAVIMSREADDQTAYRSHSYDPAGVVEGSGSGSGSDSDSDGSIDMLAFVRMSNPEAIAAIERDFDDDRLRAAQDQPPGSSDATADYSREKTGSGPSSSDYSSSEENGDGSSS